ncbi:MAG: EAL domain-containing protein, partial [Cellulosilyticum sp.]|nr:EAL domain-containing protein [Cellulosilyticum sp.]
NESTRIYLANTVTIMRANNNLVYYVCVSKDISNTFKLKEEYYKANYLDPLTHYPNQKIFVESLDRQVKKAKEVHQKLAIILLDIEKVGEINTYYGISMGDYVIKEVGRRIKEEIYNHQTLFKYSGSVFAILQQNVIEEKEIEQFLLKIHQVIERPISIQGRKIYIGLNIGVALYPNDGASTSKLIEMAQVALIYAKKQKKSSGACIYYSRAIQEELELNKQLEIDLQRAVKNDEFIVYYQPFVDLKEEKIVGMEALIRRQKQDGQIIAPDVFISELERMDLIGQVGMRILEKVCIQIRQWLDKGYNIVPISVNISALQFKNPYLVNHIKEILRTYNIAPRYIVLEITETTIIEDVESVKLTIEELRNSGFTISIDDFGTGYASIGYLKKFMFDHLKIDMSFIREIVVNSEDRAIVEAIIAIAKTLHLKTIAEGIENEEQLYIVSALGCEMGQGYFWDKPISAHKIEEKYFIRCR